MALAQIAVVIYSSYYMAAAVPGVIGILYLVQIFYLRTSRQLRILEIDAKAPLLTHFIESVQGLTTIRTFGWSEKYRWRLDALLDLSQRPLHYLYCAQRWLNLALDLVIAFIAVILVSIAVSSSGSSASLIGLALVNIVGLAVTFKGLVRMWTTLEVAMGALARIRRFATDTPREWNDGEVKEPALDWPRRGEVSFLDVTAAYEQVVSANSEYGLY